MVGTCTALLLLACFSVLAVWLPFTIRRWAVISSKLREAAWGVQTQQTKLSARCCAVWRPSCQVAGICFGLHEIILLMEQPLLLVAKLIIPPLAVSPGTVVMDACAIFESSTIDILNRRYVGQIRQQQHHAHLVQENHVTGLRAPA